MKQVLKPTKLQKYSFIFSMPVIDFVINYIMYDERMFTDISIWLVSFPLLFIIGFISWRSLVLIANWIRFTYPHMHQARIRILILAFCVVPFMSFCVLLIFYFYDALGILGYVLNTNDLKLGLFVGFSVNLIFETLYEGDYAMEKYKEGLEEKEQMRQMSVHQEFDALKSQVNPHFLFNCFNTLSSLISEDRQKAEQFLNELSKVYRYLLQNNQSELSTVESEIKFIRSYFQLLRTRHGEAVQMNIEIDKRYEPYLLPSLSLQLLVENVVKHNMLSRNKPLIIEIFTTAGNKLVVNNNLQRRVIKAPSNKVGLDNIKAKYDLLKKSGFQVLEDERNFTVVLPLIWNNSHENRIIEQEYIKLNPEKIKH